MTLSTLYLGNCGPGTAVYEGHAGCLVSTISSISKQRDIGDARYILKDGGFTALEEQNQVG